MTIFVTFWCGGELSDTGWHALCYGFAWPCHGMAWGSFGTFVPKSRDEKKAPRGGHCEGLGGSCAPECAFYDVFGNAECRSRDDDGDAVGDTA